jgi:hypothetical protein
VIKGLWHSIECVNPVVNILFHKRNLNYDVSCFGINTIVNMIPVSNAHPNSIPVHLRHSPRLTIQYLNLIISKYLSILVFALPKGLLVN